MQTIVDITKAKNAYPYEEYKALVIQLSENSQTTGTDPLPERIEATKMNAQRMKRIDKQFVPDEELKKLIENNKEEWIWLVLAESWCGDGAQNIPVIAKIAAISPNIKLKILLRDENPEIMDTYLTNGSRSIPKLICINAETHNEIGVWGSRPKTIQEMVKEYKTQNPDATHDEFVKNLHLWYAKDKGEALSKEFFNLLKEWMKV